MATKRKRKKKPGRKPVKVKIHGDPGPVIDRLLGKGGSPSRSERRA